MEKKPEIDDILKKKIIENKPGGGPKRVIKNVKILDPSKISFDVKRKIAEALTKLNATNASKKTVIPQEAKVAKQEPQQKLSAGENKSTTKRKSNEIKVLSVEKVDTPSLVQKLTNIPKCYVTDIIPGTKTTEIKLEIPSEAQIGTLRTKETNNNTTLSKAKIPVIHKIPQTQQTLTAERAENISVTNIPAPKAKAHTPVIQNNVQSQEVLTIGRDHPVPTASVIRNEQVERIVSTKKREKVIVAPKVQTPLIHNSLPAQEMPAPKIIDITEASKASRGTHVKKTTEFDVKSILNAKIKQKNSRISNDIKEENKGSLSDQTCKREVPSTHRLEHRNESPSNVFTKFENKINPKDLDKPFRGFTPEEIKSESEKLEMIIRAVDNSQAGKTTHYGDKNLLIQSKPHYKTRVSRKNYNTIQTSDKGISHVDNVAVKGGIDTSDIVSEHCYVTNAPFSSHQQRIDDSTSNENVYPKANRDSLQISELYNKNVSNTLSSKDLRLSHSHPSEVDAGISSHQTDRPNNESYKDVSPELPSISSLKLPIKKYERKQKEMLVRNLFSAANVKCDLSIIKVENTPKDSSHCMPSLGKESNLNKIVQHKNADSEKSVVKVGDIIDISSLKILPNYNEKISRLVIPEDKKTQSKTTEFASTSKEIGDRTVLKESRNKEVELPKRVEVTSRNPNIEKVKVEDNTISKSSISTQPSSDKPKSTGSTKKKECLHEEAKELSEKICQVSNATFSDDVVKVVKFLFPYIDVGTLNTELSKRNQKPIIKEEYQDAVSFLLNCNPVNENIEDDEDYAFSYLDILSDSDDVDEDMSVDHSEVQNVDNTAVIQIKKDPEQLSTEASQKRTLLEPVCKDEKSPIQGALENNERTNKHFTSNTMVVVEQDQALDLSKTSTMSTPKSNLSSKISGYDENPIVSSGGSPISVNLKSETNSNLKMVSNNSYKDDMRKATKTKEFFVGPNSGAGESKNQSIVESKEDDGNNTMLQLKATSVDLPCEDSQKHPDEEIVELSEDDYVDEEYDNQSMTEEVVNLDFSMPLISSFSTDYESKVLQQVSKNILVDILSKEDSISREGKYQPTMQAEQFIERMTALEQSGFAIDLDSMKPTNVPNDVRVEILSMEGSNDREYLDEDTAITEQRDTTADMPSMEAEQISENISVEVIPVEDSENYESGNLLVEQSEDLHEKNNESDLSVVSMDLEPQETATVSEHDVEMQSAEKNEVIFELDVNYNENEGKCVSKSTNSERISEVKTSDVIKKENNYQPKPHKFIQSVSGLRELKNTLLLSSAVEHAQNSNIKTNTVEETKICDEKLQKEDSTDKKEGATNPQAIKKPFKSRKAKVNLVQAKRRNVQTIKKQTGDQPNSLESEGTNLKLKQSDDKEVVMQKGNVSISNENQMDNQSNSLEGTQTDVHISAEKKIIKTEQRSDTEEETIKRKLPAEDNVPLESYDTAMTMIQLHTNSPHDFKVERTSRNESHEDSLTSTQYEVPLISDKIRLLIEENKNLFNEIPSPQYEQFSPIKSQTLHIVDGVNETAVQQKIDENSDGAESSKLSSIDAGSSYEKESKIVETRRRSEEKNTLQSKPENTNQVQYEELECTVVDEEVFEVSVNNDSLREESCVSPASSDHSFGEHVSITDDSVFESLKAAEEENGEKLQTVAACTEVKETNKLVVNLDDERKIGEKTLLQNEDSPKINVDEANVQANTSDAHSSGTIIERDRNIISKFDKSSSKSVEPIQVDTDTDGEDSRGSILECTDSPLKSRSCSNEIVLETNVHVVHDEEECRIDDMSDGDKNVPVKSSDAITTQVIPNKIVENIHEQTKLDKAGPTESTCERDENALMKSTDSSLENKISESKLPTESTCERDENVLVKSTDSSLENKISESKLVVEKDEQHDNKCRAESITKSDANDANVSLKSINSAIKTEDNPENSAVVERVQDGRVDSTPKDEGNVSLLNIEASDNKIAEKPNLKVKHKVRFDCKIDSVSETEKKVALKSNEPFIKQEVSPNENKVPTNVQARQSMEPQTEGEINVSVEDSDPPVKRKRVRKKAVPNIIVQSKQNKERRTDSLSDNGRNVSDKGSDSSIKNKATAKKKTSVSNVEVNILMQSKQNEERRTDSLSDNGRNVSDKGSDSSIKNKATAKKKTPVSNVEANILVQSKQNEERRTDSLSDSGTNVSDKGSDSSIKNKATAKKKTPVSTVEANILVQSKQNEERRTDSLSDNSRNVSDKGSDSSIKNKASAKKKTPVRNVEAKHDKEKPVDSKSSSSNTSSAEKVSETSPTQKSQITSYFIKTEKTSPKTDTKQTIAPTESLNNNMTEKQFESALNLKRRHSKTDTPANSSNTPKKSKLFGDCWAEDSDAKPKAEKITSSFLVKEIGMQSTPARSSKTTEKNIESVSSKDTSSESRLSPEPPKKKAKPDNVEDSDHCDTETQSSNIVYFMPNEKFDYDELHPNILLIDKAEDLNKPIVDKNVPIPNGSVKCGACKEIVVKRRIEAHYATHYFIGWIDGADEPVNLRSHREVANKIMKMSKKKTKVLCCRICSVEKKSAHGMISHLLDCAKANKIFACKLCKMTVKRSSIYAHTAYCKALRKADVEIKEKKRKAEAGSTEITEHSVTGRVKRRSVIKAEKKFKEISGNNFEADWYIAQFKKKIVSAVDTEGSGKPSKVTFQTGYKCTLCNAFTSDNQEDVSNHISDVHRKEMCPPPFSNHSEDEAVIEPESSSESEVSADEDDIENTEKNKKRERKPKSKKSIETKNTSLNVTICENQILYSKILATALYAERNLGFYDFSPFKAFARRFRDINYFNHYILPECKPFSRELNSDVWEQYKPNNALSIKYYYKNITKPSLQYGSSSVPEKWLQLQNFEIAKRADEELLYLGGPINFLQWVPLPDDYPKNEPQFLVVAIKQRYNLFTKVKNPKTRKTLIQIWEISYKEKSSRLYYSIAIENGPIYSIAFLPSGGYAPSLNRMALIVVSTVNAEIRLFPLPLKAPQNCDNSKSSISPLLDIKPFAYLKLDVRTNHENKTHKEAECIQLCWSESKGHNFIFGGFTNGFVAIWDIDQEDNLNKFSLQGSVAFIPFAYFGAVTAIISSVQVHYDERGPRWLLVTSDSRECKIYDLCDINLPVSINNDDLLRSRCSASCWPYYWQNPSLLLTDEFIAGPPHVLQKSPSGVVYRYKNNLPTSSNLNDISFSCWYNTLLVGTDNGDIYIRKQYNTLFDTTANRWKKGRFVGCTEIIRLDGSSMPKLSQSEKEKDHLAHDIRKIFDRDYMDKYGILFTSIVDAPINPYDKLTFTSRNPPHSLRDFVRISRVSINNNYVAKRLYAVGYENGFVRIRSLDELYK